MLAQKYRANRTEIEEVMRFGKTIPGSFLYAKFFKNKENSPKFAVIVSKKNQKTSVKRHLIKRRVVAVIQKNLPNIKKVFNKNIVFLLKNKEIQDFSEIEKEIKDIFKKIDPKFDL